MNISVYLPPDSDIEKGYDVLLSTAFRGTSGSEFFRMLLLAYLTKQGVLTPEGNFDVAIAAKIRQQYPHSILNLPERLLMEKPDIKTAVEQARKTPEEASEVRAETVVGDIVETDQPKEIE